MSGLSLHTLPRLYRTLKYLRPRQIVSRVTFKVRGKLEQALPSLVARRYAVDAASVSLRLSPDDLCHGLEAWYAPSEATCAIYRTTWQALAQGRITFLNETASFDTFPDWKPADRDRLWQLNLHYFEYAVEAAWLIRRTGDAGAAERLKALLLDWIAQNPVGRPYAWDPYALSLRVVNWIKVYALCGAFMQDDAAFRGLFLQSLYQQVRYLRTHIEYHILANHLFENYRTLFIAGRFFDGSEAEAWRAFASPRLLDELDEEILEDGGHYERSPAYHCTMLDHTLDLLLFMPEQGPERTATARFVERMGDYLAAFPRTDNYFPHFNDSASNVCLDPAILERRLQAVGLVPDAARSRTDLVDDGSVLAYALKQSGYYVIQHDKWLFILDGGEVGPSYQPSHAHCDTFSFWLFYDGRPVLTEAGTYGYYNDPAMRAYCRSTKAHNTVTLDDHDQAEVWHNFRLGHRPVPEVTDWAYRDGRLTWTGRHDGFAYLDAGLEVTRALTALVEEGLVLHFDDAWTGGRRAHTMQGYVHVAPGAKVHVEAEKAVVSLNDGVRLILHGPGPWRREQGWYCPAFGVREASDVLSFAAGQAASWRIEAVGPPTASSRPSILHP